MAKASVDEQHAAQQWIQEAMTSAADTTADAQAMKDKASLLSNASLEIIGRVLGLGSTTETKQTLAQLNAYSLTSLQQTLGSMGMEHRPGRQA